MSNPGSTSAFYASEPVISLDGQIDPELGAGLLTLMVEETNSGLYRCEATFGNWGSGNQEVGFVYFNRQVLDFGKPFAVTVGDQDTEAQIFNGRIMALEANYPQKAVPEITVLAEDRFQELRMSRRTRTFEDVSDQDVIEEIAAQHSLQTDLDIDGPTYNVLAQLNQSDLAFLRDRARAIDAEIWLDDSTLHVQSRARRESDEVVSLTYRQGLLEFSILADLAHQRTAYTVSGWDVAAKEAIEYAAAASVIQSELNGHLGGGSILQQAVGEKTEQIVHLVPFTTTEAQHLADAHYRGTARRFVTGTGLCAGDGRLRVGTQVDLGGLGILFNGRYTITTVRHLYDGSNGYRTQFNVERPGIGQ